MLVHCKRIATESIEIFSFSCDAGPFNEHFPESHCCATPDGRGNENICPADKVKLPVVVSKRSGKGGRLNLRKSLAWNPAFFTEEGDLSWKLHLKY